MYFSLAPLLIYAFMNWDLLAVALATVATLAFFRERTAERHLGLGAAAKAYPALLIVPFALDAGGRGVTAMRASVGGAAAGWW